MGGQNCFSLFRAIAPAQPEWQDHLLRFDASWCQAFMPVPEAVVQYLQNWVTAHDGVRNVIIHFESERPSHKWENRPDKDGQVVPEVERPGRCHQRHIRNLQLARRLRGIFPELEFYHALFETDDALGDALAWEVLLGERQTLPVAWDADLLTKSGNWQAELMAPTGKEAFSLETILRRMAIQVLEGHEGRDDSPTEEEIFEVALALFRGLCCSARLGPLDQSPQKSILSPAVMPPMFKCTIPQLQELSVCRQNEEFSFVPSIIGHLVKRGVLPGKDPKCTPAWATKRLSDTEEAQYSAPACTYIWEQDILQTVILPRCVLALMQEISATSARRRRNSVASIEKVEGDKEKVREALMGLMELRGKVSKLTDECVDEKQETRMIKMIVRYLMRVLDAVSVVYSASLITRIKNLYPLATKQFQRWPTPPWSWQNTIFQSGLRRRAFPWEPIPESLTHWTSSSTVLLPGIDIFIQALSLSGKPEKEQERVERVKTLLMKAEKRVAASSDLQKMVEELRRSKCVSWCHQGIPILMDFLLGLAELEAVQVPGAVAEWKEDARLLWPPMRHNKFVWDAPLAYVQSFEKEYLKENMLSSMIPPELRPEWFDPYYRDWSAELNLSDEVSKVWVTLNLSHTPVLLSLKEKWQASATTLSFCSWLNEAPLSGLYSRYAEDVPREKMTKTLVKLVKRGQIDRAVVDRWLGGRVLAHRPEMWELKPELDNWEDQKPWLREIIEAVANRLPDENRNRPLRQLLYDMFDLFLRESGSPDGIRSYVFPRGESFQNSYITCMTTHSNQPRSPTGVVYGLCCDLFQEIGQAYGAKSLLTTFNAALFTVVNETESLFCFINLLASVGLQSLATAILNKDMEECLKRQSHVGGVHVNRPHMFITLTRGLFAWLNSVASPFWMDGEASAGGAAALFLMWTQEVIPGTSLKAVDLRKFSSWLHRYSGFRLSDKVLTSRWVRTGGKGNDPSLRAWVAAIISRGPVFCVLLADCILDVEGVEHHKLVIHFYQLLAIWLCWEHDASGQLVPYNVPTGQKSVWRAFLGGRAGEPVVAVIPDLAEGLLAEAGDMISSVRQGTASEYTSQRMFAIPGVERVVKRWRKALRQAGAEYLSAPSSCLVERHGVWSQGLDFPEDLCQGTTIVFKELAVPITAGPAWKPEQWEMRGASMVSQSLPDGEWRGVVGFASQALKDMYSRDKYLLPL